MQSNHQRHSFHLVTPSPWPLLAAVAALITTFGGVMYMHSYQNGGWTLSWGLVLLLAVTATWWRDVIRESTFEGSQLKLGNFFIIMAIIFYYFTEIEEDFILLFNNNFFCSSNFYY
jgi:cytochrome c oxidase subunit 3